MVSLSEVGRKNIIDFLVKYTNYHKTFFSKMKDNQLYAVYMKYYNKRDFYIKELTKKNPETDRPFCSYGIETLKTFKIDFLAKTYKMILGNEKYENVFNNAISESNERDLAYLTPTELSMIFGLDYLDMSEEELRKHGYAVIENEDLEMLVTLKQEIRDKIIELLVSGQFKHYSGRCYSRNELDNKDFDSLINLYRKLTVNLDDYPTYETMEFQLRLMHN